MSFRNRLSKWWFGFSNAEHPLTRAQRAKYAAHVQHLMGKDRRTWVLALMPAVVVIGISELSRHFGPASAYASWRVSMVVLLCLATPYVIWISRWKYRRYGPRALRELGLADVCPHCAYDLRQHSGTDGRCPECGKSFARFLPDENWQHMDI